MPLNEVLEGFSSATQSIEPHYMALPMNAQEARPLERVYAYELYHQLRVETDHIPRYSWGGEVDKASHRHFVNPGLKAKKPDLLYHQPGNHGGNIVVIEIKTFLGAKKRRDVKVDLQTLSAFRQDQGLFRSYRKAIYLIVGGTEIDSLRVRAVNLDNKDGINLSLIDLYWHKRAGEPAINVSWE